LSFNSHSGGQLRDDNEKLNISMFDLFTVMYMLNKLLPVFGYYLPGIVFLGLFAFLMFFSFCRICAMGKDAKLMKTFALLAVAFLACIRLTAANNVSSIPMYMYGELQVTLYGLIVISYQNEARSQKLEMLFRMVLVCYVITGVTTLVGNINYPEASRILATLSSTDAEYALYMLNNIGGFSFVYELVLMTPLLVYMIRNKRINVLIGSSMLVLFAFVIINAGYTTALILYIVSLLTFFVGKLSHKKTIGLFALFASLAFFASSTIANLFLSLSKQVSNEIFSQRFEYIAYALTGEGSKDVTEHGDRMSLYQKSIDSFVESKGFGLWKTGETSGHSFVLDTMAIYGFVGIIAVIIIYVMIYKLCLKPYKNKDFFGYMVWTYLTGMILAVLNPKVFFFHFLVTMTLFACVMAKGDGGKKNENTVDSK